jgi:O-antigen/teichoic acid export membrane protein
MMSTNDRSRTVPHPAGPSTAPHRRDASLVTSALGMMTGKAAAMFLGFAFWLVAARIAPAAHVGLAAGATSTIMLVTLLSSSGLGAAAIIHYHRNDDQTVAVVDSALTMAGMLSCVIGLGFLVFAGRFLEEMDAIAVDPTFAILFGFMSVVGTLGVVIDQISMAQRRGHDVMTRNVTNGLVTLAVPGLIWIGLFGESARLLFAGWVLGSTSAIAIGWMQLHRILDGHWSRPHLSRTTIRPLLATSVSNQMLTTAERAPGLLLPLIVTEFLSPEQNAYWYTSWMIAWGVAVVPLSTSTALFAEACRDPLDSGRHLRAALRSSLTIGTGLAAVVMVFAPLVLRFAGPDYASAATTPVRLLVLTVIPLSFIYPYFALARSTGRIVEAIATAVIGGVIGITAATIAGVMFGLSQMALAWVLAELVISVWAGWRLRSMTTRASESGSQPQPALITGD